MAVLQTAVLLYNIIMYNTVLLAHMSTSAQSELLGSVCDCLPLSCVIIVRCQ